jgi:hypothetical protein
MLINIPGYGTFGIGNLVSGLMAPGRVFFLNDAATLKADSTAAAAMDPTTPAATGAACVAFCTANNGDVIIVGPNHSESIATLLALTLPARTIMVHTGLGVAWSGRKFGSAAGSLESDVVEKTVERAASILPATTNLTLFTIAGGPIELINIEGIVTVVMSGTANLVKLTALATGLTAVDLCAASASVAAAAVGTVLSITGTVADAMILSPNQTRISQAGRLVIHPGIIRVNTTGTNATGQVKWSMRYRPLAAGAYAVAA